MQKMFSLSAMFVFFNFAHENMKKPASKVDEPAQMQPKSQFLFHKNLPPRDFSIMTLKSFIFFFLSAIFWAEYYLVRYNISEKWYIFQMITQLGKGLPQLILDIVMAPPAGRALRHWFTWQDFFRRTKIQRTWMTPKRNVPNDSRTFLNLNTRDVGRSRKFGGEKGGWVWAVRNNHQYVIDWRLSMCKMRGQLQPPFPSSVPTDVDTEVYNVNCR